MEKTLFRRFFTDNAQPNEPIIFISPPIGTLSLENRISRPDAPGLTPSVGSFFDFLKFLINFCTDNSQSAPFGVKITLPLL